MNVYISYCKSVLCQNALPDTILAIYPGLGQAEVMLVFLSGRFEFMQDCSSYSGLINAAGMKERQMPFRAPQLKKKKQLNSGHFWLC